MALDSAKQRAGYSQSVLQLTHEEPRTTSSELSSECSDSSEFFSDSDTCYNLDWKIPSDVATVEYKYSPLKCDSDVDNDVDNSSDESIALLAHEILCCEHDSDTETDSGDDIEDDDETVHNYALLMCSEDDEDMIEQQQQEEQLQMTSESLLQLSTEQHSSSESCEAEQIQLQD